MPRALFDLYREQDWNDRLNRLAESCSAKVTVNRFLWIQPSKKMPPLKQNEMESLVLTPLQNSVSSLADSCTDGNLVKERLRRVGDQRLNQLKAVYKKINDEIQASEFKKYLKDRKLRSQLSLQDYLNQTQFKRLCAAKCLSYGVIQDIDAGDQGLMTYFKSYGLMAENEPGISLAWGWGVCRHHADIFTSILKHVGMASIKINTATHQFNQIFVNGKMYATDPNLGDCHFFEVD